METIKLEPDISRISESLRVLAEEIPRISNLESTAILRAIQDLRENISHNNIQLIADKLDKIQETLTSLEVRITRLEQPIVSIPHAHEPGDQLSLKAEDRDTSESSQSITAETSASHDVNPKLSFQRLDPSGAPRIQGVSGALLLILATLVPIIYVIMASE